jgi:hypothetical protein
MFHSEMNLAALDFDTTAARFLTAVPNRLRLDVWSLMTSPRRGGRGLRAWLALLEVDHPPLPGELPQELVEVYLRDQEAEPLHDCEECGLPVPVRCGRRIGREPVAEQEYFPSCPSCGGRTGRHAFWSRGPRSTS